MFLYFKITVYIKIYYNIALFSENKRYVLYSGGGGGPWTLPPGWKVTGGLPYPKIRRNHVSLHIRETDKPWFSPFFP